MHPIRWRGPMISSVTWLNINNADRIIQVIQNKWATFKIFMSIKKHLPIAKKNLFFQIQNSARIQLLLLSTPDFPNGSDKDL